MAVGAVLLALADQPDKYWSHFVPAFIIGTAGMAMAYVGVSVAIMADAPKGEEVCVSMLIINASS